MRKKDREIIDRGEIEAILAAADVCRIALSDDNAPYIVPVCFGYAGDCLYFHCAPEGRKLDILRRNNRVCFEMETGCRVAKTQDPCRWGMAYRSVIGFGRAFITEDIQEKIRALDVIMAHYAGGTGDYSPEALAFVTVVRIEIESMTAKHGREGV